MATTIVTKNGSGAPTASDLVAGELAVDLTNGRLYTEDSGGSVIEIGLNPSGNVDVTGTVTADGLTVDGNATFTTTDNTAQVALVSTDADASDGPILEMFRNSSSPADDDDLGIIKFFGENDASEKIEYGIIEVKAVDVSDGTEDGSINITAILNGTARSRLFSNSTETVLNEGSQDIDFRVESDNNSHALFVQGSDGSVGIATSSPDSGYKLDVAGNVVFGDGGGFDMNVDGTRWQFSLGGSEKMRIDGATGNLLLGKTSDAINVAGVVNYGAGIVRASRNGNSGQFGRISTDGDIVTFYKDTVTVGNIGTLNSALTIGTGDTGIQFNADNNAVMPHNITTGANVDNSIDIGYSSGGTNRRFKDLYLSGSITSGANGGLIKEIGGDTSIVQGAIGLRINDAALALSPTTASANNDASVDLGVSNIRFKDLYLSGAISKGSGSFKIDHPLPEKTDTHHLVHSFVEAPQADNIYRGKVDLVDGSATVNIDDAAGMTEGTYVLLNTNTQCFTSNESGWTAVKGSVSGNTLTITAQDNTCTDTISWMVIGERHDQHMFDTEWTDENGRVIVEPLKES